MSEGRCEFHGVWTLKIIDVQLDDKSPHVPTAEEYRVLLWLADNHDCMMMTGPSRSNPNPTWNEEFNVGAWETIRQYEYLNLEVVQEGKEPGTSKGSGAVARLRFRLPNSYRKKYKRLTLVSMCEGSADCRSVGFISLIIKRRRLLC